MGRIVVRCSSFAVRLPFLLCAFLCDLRVLCGFGFRRRQHREDGVEQIVNPAAMFGGDRKHIPDPKPVKFPEQRLLLVAIHLVDGEEERLAGARQESRQFAIGPGDLGASVHDHDDGRRFLERDPGLTEDLRRDELLVFGNDAARIHHPKLAPAPFRLAVETVASDAGLVADDGAPRSGQPVEERGFADVGAAHDSNQGQHGGIGFGRSLFH